MNIETTRNFFLWCTLLNYAVLLIWAAMFWLAHDWHYGLTKMFFRGLSAERYDMVSLFGIAIYKVAVIVLNLVPYIALCIISR